MNAWKITIIFSLFLLLIGCAEQRVSEGVQAENREAREESREISGEQETFPLLEEPLKQYSVNENGDYEIECTEEQQNRVQQFGNDIHVVWTAASEDGKAWTEGQYLMPGSVPEVILFNEKYYMFVMGSCLMYVSEDGVTFEPYTYILKNKNLPERLKKLDGVDPTAIVDEGKIRLFFYEPDFKGGNPSDPGMVEGEHSIVQYISEDAITWERVGEAVAVEQVTDPDIVLYNDKYYLFLSKGTSVIAASSDEGETFSVLNNGATVHNHGGVPDTLVMDNALYMYAHRPEQENTAIKILKSTNGLSWEVLGTAVEDGGAPSVVQLSDGTYRMYYVKGMSEEEYGKLTR